MRNYPTSCRVARRDLLRRDELDAVERGLLDLHLRRCDPCRDIAESLAVIEARPEELPEITQEQIRTVYTRLVPAVHQITARLERGESARTGGWRVPMMVFGAALAVLLAALAFLFFQHPDRASSKVRMAAADRGPVPTEPDRPLVGLIDRCEGVVRIGGEAASGKRRFDLGTPTRVTLGNASRLGFRLGDLARIALLGETDWELYDAGSDHVAIRLTKGRLAVDFKGPPGTTLTVRTPDLEVRVKGTVFTVEVQEGKESRVAVLEGSVEVVPLGDRDRRVAVLEGARVAFPGRGVTEPAGDAERALAAELGPEGGPVQATRPIAGSGPKPAAGQRPSRPERPMSRAVEPSGKRTDLLDQARAAVGEGQLPRAVGLLERAGEETEGEARVNALALLAECYGAMGRYAKATEVYERIVEAAPGSRAAQNAHYEIGRIAMDRMGDIPRARAAFLAHVASPQAGGLKEDAQFSLCELDGREGAHREALGCFDRFIQSFRGSANEPYARLWRGALYQDVEQSWAKAEKDLRFFLAERPTHPRTDEAAYRVALGRFQMGDQQGALLAIREYLAQHPQGKYRLRVERLRQTIVNPQGHWEPEK